MKQRTGSLQPKEPRNTVLGWVADRGNELVEEEIGSGTRIDQDDFKAAVDQFSKRLKMVEKELDTQVKSQKEHAAELYEAARLQSAMAFGLDNKPILGVDAPSNSSGIRTASSSISLNPVARAA